MPVITSISPQKNGRRVNVYLDGRFGFGIDLENLVVLGLKVDQEYTQSQIEKIIKKAEFQKVQDKLINFAMVRPRSEKEVGDWFRRKKVHESLWKDLIEKMFKLELLDDHKFAAWWVEQRASFRPKGKKAIELELYQKGISKDIISEVLSLSPIDEEKIAKELLKKTESKWKRYDKNEVYTKKAQFLARKGIGWDTVRKVLKIDPLDQIE
jgi:regulatory protein